jgi:hypothetical protein
MPVDSETMFHAAYVAFAFACMFFGALAYRQVLDNLDVKRLRFGEERSRFMGSTGVFACLGAAIVTVTIAQIVWAIPKPTVYWYALPLILGVQNLQMGLRFWFQRTTVTTHGILVRSALFQQHRAIPFEQILHIHVKHSWLVTTVFVLGSNPKPVVFRIFRMSWPALHHILQSSCRCPVDL